MKQIICIGSACKDIFFPTAEGVIMETPEDLMAQEKIAFELGAKYKIENRYEALGGCAANVASGLAKLGIDVSCYSHIGNDYIAGWIVDNLKKNGVDTELVTRDQELPSDMSAIIVDQKSGERVIFSNQRANGQLEIVPEKIRDAQWFFIGDLHGDWEEDLAVIVSVAKNNNIKLAYNPRQANIHDNVKKVLEIIPHCEVLFLNKDEAVEILSGYKSDYSLDNLKNEEFLVKELNNLGAKTIVVTDGVRGAWAYSGSDLEFVPGKKVDAVDSTGAGDSFASGFLAAHLKGKTLKECCHWGIANSSHEVQFYGAIEGLLTEEEILEK